MADPMPPVAPAGARPEVARLTPGAWVRANLFNSRLNGVITVIFGTLLAIGLVRAVRFVFFTAQWEIVRVNLTNYMVGFFPRDQLWRPWTAVFVLMVTIGLRWGIAGAQAALLDGDARPTAPWGALGRVWPIGLLLVVIATLSGSLTTISTILGVIAVLLLARVAGRRAPRWIVRHPALVVLVGAVIAFETIALFGGVGTDQWRGLLLTLFLAAAGIALSFPFGVLLALGRRSSFPAIRLISVGYIELIRGVPLITLLFMSFLILGFFLPAGYSIPSLVSRVLVALVLFTAAYIAEIVRGGLQSVPQGQIEAAQALGLSPLATTRTIVLPQALRAVIPAIVGQFISLFKDTSLVAIVGLTELLGVAQNVTKQPEFLGRGLQAETLTFAAFIYWVGAYWMSRSSQRLEKRLGVGQR